MQRSDAAIGSFGVRACVAVAAAGGLLAATSWFQEADAAAASWAGGLVTSSVRQVVSERAVLVVPRTDVPLFAMVTPICSSVVPVAVVAVIGLVLTRRWTVRSVLRLTAAVGVAYVVNTLRLASVMVIGGRFGRAPMSMAHDWLGTVMTLIGIVIGVALVVRGATRQHAAQPATAPGGAGVVS